jgi:uncharacterized membrane protein HdeD (DUF308 family)
MIGEPQTLPQSDSEQLKAMTKEWFWFFLLGIAMVALGMFAIGSAPFTTWAVARLFGIILIAAGIVQTVTSFWSPRWSGVFIYMLLGIMYIIVGWLVADSPVDAAGAFALLVAAFFIISGMFRIVASLHMRFANWGWSLLSGFVSLLLGIWIWTNWPCSTIVIGIFVGLELLFNGWAWVMFGMLLRSLGKQLTAEAP